MMDRPDVPLEDALPVARTQVPTLMIGLGGVGSKIVERLYGRIPSDERWRFATHVIDTDINTIARLQFMKTEDRRTGIGTELLVGELRHFYPETDAWMPPPNVHLDAKSTLQGAGQVRAVSRLSWLHLLRSDGIAGLRRALWRLQQLANPETGSVLNPRVWVFSSLAGGTGAGVLIPVGLLLRGLIRQQLGDAGGFTLNGVFVLPDAVIRTNPEISPAFHTAMRANGQAVIQELEAINASLNGHTEPLFVEATERGDRQRIDEMPFDYSFLFDYVNENNQVLPDYDAYVDQVARSMHLLLFSPMAPNTNSSADNLIRGQLANHGRARYAAPSTTSLVFPRAEVARYLSARWGAEQLDELWLGPDRVFAEALKKHKDDLKRHNVTPEPDRGETFIADVQRRAAEKKAHSPFFRSVIAQAHEGGTEHEAGRSRGRAWIKAIEAEMQQRVQAAAPQPLHVDGQQLRTAGGLRHEIESAESKLHGYRQRTFQFIGKNAARWEREIIAADQDDDHVAKGEGRHRLNYWMFDGEDAIHPLSVRYALYEASTALDKRLQQLSHENERSENELMSYEARYDDPSTKDVEETLDDRIRSAMRGGLIAKLTRRSAIERLAEDYEKRSKAQYALIVTYLKSKALEVVLTQVRTQVQILTEAWEQFFAILDAVRTRLEADAVALFGAHERDRRADVRYVFADKRAKELLWSQLADVTLDREIDEVNTFAYRMLFRRVFDPGATTDQGIARGFQRGLLDTLTDVLYGLDVLPQGIVEAITMEGKLENVAPDAYATRLLERVANSASPFVQLRTGPEVGLNEAFWWGIHPRERERLPSKAAEYVGIDHQAVDPAYSQDEILYLQVPHLVKALDLVSVTTGIKTASIEQPDGAYVKAYRDHAEAVAEGQVTVHLDATWDESLPRFWEANWLLNRCLIHGYALGVLFEEDGRWKADLGGDRGSVELGDARHLGQLRSLQEGLARSADFDAIMHRVESVIGEEFEASRAKDVTYHTFIKGVRPSKPKADTKRNRAVVEKGLFALVVESFFGSAHEDAAIRADRTQTLFAALCDEVRRYVGHAEGDPEYAAHRARLVIKKGFATAMKMQNARKRPKLPRDLATNLESIVRSYGR